MTNLDDFLSLFAIADSEHFRGGERYVMLKRMRAADTHRHDGEVGERPPHHHRSFEVRSILSNTHEDLLS